MQKNVKLPKESIHMTPPDSGENIPTPVEDDDVEGHKA